MNSTKTIAPRLVLKLWISLIIVVILMALTFIGITNYFSSRHQLATQQEVNAELAQHLIDEKFAQEKPFLEDGSVNKALFGDLMHDMMAINRSIEVYLLSPKGEILYSVVLEHSPDQPSKYVDLKPITTFVDSDGREFIQGDDPKDPGKKKIFSAAAFDVDGKQGYIYIILAGENYQVAQSHLFGEYLSSIGIWSITFAALFILALGGIGIWVITKNLRQLTNVVLRFKEGDLTARISKPEKTDIEIYATAFNDMADTINENLEKIKSVDQLRRNLIANVSHDLRTPLAIIQGYAETLLEKTENNRDGKDLEYLKIIHSNSERLNKLVEQLFEYSKLEAKQIEPVIEDFSITDLCLDLVGKNQILAEKRKISLALEADKSSNIVVMGDIALIERAIQNLIDNAIKFTPKSGRISIYLEQSGKDCLIKVNDSGIGIDKDLQVRIFERYKQIDDGSIENGAGLGLTIVKKILELHQSTITVFSQKNKGSSFAFHLPVAG